MWDRPFVHRGLQLYSQKAFTTLSINGILPIMPFRKWIERSRKKQSPSTRPILVPSKCRASHVWKFPRQFGNSAPPPLPAGQFSRVVRMTPAFEKPDTREPSVAAPTFVLPVYYSGINYASAAALRALPGLTFDLSRDSPLIRLRCSDWQTNPFRAPRHCGAKCLVFPRRFPTTRFPVYILDVTKQRCSPPLNPGAARHELIAFGSFQIGRCRSSSVPGSDPTTRRDFRSVRACPPQYLLVLLKNGGLSFSPAIFSSYGFLVA